MVTVFILTSVRLYREGLEATLVNREGLRVLGSGGFSFESFQRLANLAPDTVIIGYPGLECVSAIKDMMGRLPKSRFVVVGCNDSDHEILSCASLGVSGIVPLEASVEELVLTVSCATRGEFRCSPRATAALVRCFAQGVGPMKDTLEGSTTLTPREREIGHLIERGYANKQIARALNIQPSTVKNHVHKILEKLKVANRVQAAAHLRQVLSSSGLVPDPRDESAI